MPSVLPDSGSDTRVFAIVLNEARLAEIHVLAKAVSDPARPEYGRYLTRDQLATLSAPDPEGAKAVTDWFEQFGLNVVPVSPQLLIALDPNQKADQAFPGLTAWL